MLKRDCSELSGDAKLAMAEAISQGLSGTGVALLGGNYIAIDTLSGPDIGAPQVKSILKSYISGRKDASAHRVENDDEHLVVHSFVPATAAEKRLEEKLPPGLFQCPVCGFVATSDHAYQDHLRIHDLIRGVS